MKGIIFHEIRIMVGTINIPNNSKSNSFLVYFISKTNYDYNNNEITKKIDFFSSKDIHSYSIKVYLKLAMIGDGMFIT